MGAKRRPADRRDAPFPRLRSCGKPLARLFDIHSLQSEQVFAQNFALGLFGELRAAVAFDQVLWQLEVPEGVQSPFWGTIWGPQSRRCSCPLRTQNP